MKNLYAYGTSLQLQPAIHGMKISKIVSCSRNIRPLEYLYAYSTSQLLMKSSLHNIKSILKYNIILL